MHPAAIVGYVAPSPFSYISLLSLSLCPLGRLTGYNKICEVPLDKNNVGKEMMKAD